MADLLEGVEGETQTTPVTARGKGSGPAQQTTVAAKLNLLPSHQRKMASLLPKLGVVGQKLPVSQVALPLLLLLHFILCKSSICYRKVNKFCEKYKYNFIFVHFCLIQYFVDGNRYISSYFSLQSLLWTEKWNGGAWQFVHWVIDELCGRAPDWTKPFGEGNARPMIDMVKIFVTKSVGGGLKKDDVRHKTEMIVLAAHAVAVLSLTTVHPSQIVRELNEFKVPEEQTNTLVECILVRYDDCFGCSGSVECQ